MRLDDNSADRLHPHAEIERYTQLWNLGLVFLRFSAQLKKSWARTDPKTDEVREVERVSDSIDAGKHRR